MPRSHGTCKWRINKNDTIQESKEYEIRWTNEHMGNIVLALLLKNGVDTMLPLRKSVDIILPMRNLCGHYCS